LPSGPLSDSHLGNDTLTLSPPQVSDEFTFITDLSYQLSNRYQRPVSSIVISLQHGACMLFGGTFDPAYSMTISALPCQIQTTVNKRNAVLIQNFMDQAIGVPPSRGYLRFEQVPEGNAAWNGRTAAAAIAELEDGDGDGAQGGGSDLKTKAKKRKSVKVCPRDTSQVGEDSN